MGIRTFELDAKTQFIFSTQRKMTTERKTNFYDNKKHTQSSLFQHV